MSGARKAFYFQFTTGENLTFPVFLVLLLPASTIRLNAPL